jgi:hypothetical protein
MSLLKINLHGESWMLKKFECKDDDLTECCNVARKTNLSITEALLDPFFYYNLKNPAIPSLEHLPGTKKMGLLNSHKNQIEILVDGKKVKKLKIKDLIDQSFLFPLYNIHIVKIPEYKDHGIFIEQRAIGYVGSFEIKIAKFSVENLQFELFKYSDKLILDNITYQNKNMLFKKKATLLTYQNCFEIF